MRRMIFLAAGVVLAATAACAGERLEDTVIVTAARIAETSRSVPQMMTVIDSEELAKNQYEDLSGLLQAYGFSIDSYGPAQSSSSVSLRGMSSSFSNPLDSNVLLLVNGAPIATTNLAMIPMDGIERVEILRGPGAVQYGSSAVGGVVNIIPRRGGEKFSLAAEAGYGSWNSWRALGGLSGKLAKLDFAGAATWNAQKSNYTTGDGKLYQDTTATGRLGYLMNFGLNFNADNRFGAVILGAWDQGLGISQEIFKEQKYGGLDVRGSRVNSSVDITYDGAFQPAGLAWKCRYYNAYDQFRTDYPADYALNTPYYAYRDNSIANSASGAQGQLSWHRDFLTLTGGLDYADNQYTSGFAPKYTQKDTAGFGIVKLAFLEDILVLTGGLRYDSYIFEVQDAQKYMNHTTLSAGVAINPLAWLTFRANIGESYKVPSGLFVVGYEGSGGVEGNSGLKPEKGLTWDAGLEAHWRGFRAGLTYFATEYRDKISSAAVSSPGHAYRYYNEDGASFINGLEGQLGWDVGEFYDWDFTLRPYFNFTGLFDYSDARGERLKNVRNFVAAYGVGFNYPDWGLAMDLRFSYLGYQNEYDFGSDYPYREARTGGKTVADFFVSKTICDFGTGGKISLKGEARNFTNENYAYRADYPMPGRSFYIGIRYDF